MPYCPKPQANSGFTLVELAIVLVIIGLIVGGVLTGQALIRQAEVRSVMSDIEKFKTATFTFRNKYNALPGDITTATNIWGTAAGCPTTAGPGTATCNGDGNGNISTGLLTDGEQHRYWQHLSATGLVAGSFSGSAGVGGISDPDTTNSPSSKLSNGLYTIFYFHGDGTDPDFFPMEGNYFIFGIDVANFYNYSPILPTEEALSFDTKYDDGRPGTGEIRTFKAGGWGYSCSSTTDPATSLYDMTQTGLQCPLFFRARF